MKSRLAVTQQPAAPRTEPATPVRARPTIPVAEAANDAAPTPSFAIFGDPLWGMAIASVILFAILAALIALG